VNHCRKPNGPISHLLRSVCVGSGIAAVFAACGGTNGNGMTAPSGSSTVASFVTSATASDGTVSTIQTGAPPAPSGGPPITVSAPTTVILGAPTVVRIQSPLPFATVFAFVDGVSGFFQLSLKAPTTDTTLVVNLSSNTPTSMFTADYRVASQNGAVGVSAPVPLVASPNSSPSTNITGTWDFQGSPVFSFAQSGANVTGSEIFPPLNVQGFNISASSVIRGIVAGNVFTATNAGQVSASGSGISVQCSSTDGLALQIAGSSMTGTYTTGTITCNVPGFTAPTPLPITITLTKE
jgi:hypothetical protein